MEKHVGLNPAWFEPGPDGVSPFDREMQKARLHCTSKGHAISAAFRALIAQDAAQEPPALQVGDVVRLERFDGGHNDERIGYVGEVKEYFGTHKGRVCVVVGNYIHPVSALTLIRRAGETAPVDKDAEIARLTAERDALRKGHAEAKAQRDKFWSQRDAAITERDALQSRIDAGRVMYGGMYGHEHDIEMWTFTHVDTDTMTARLINVQPIDDHFRDAPEMGDERKGERRKANMTSPYYRRKSYFNDRRSTPGTRADRGKA